MAEQKKYPFFVTLMVTGECCDRFQVESGDTVASLAEQQGYDTAKYDAQVNFAPSDWDRLLEAEDMVTFVPKVDGN